MKIAVLGAGVSGLTAARLLKESGHDITIYEKMSSPGGLARSRYKNGYLYDPHGGHIFNSKHQEIVDWVFSLLPKENWKFTERNAKIYFNGKYISYPFELSLCELDTKDAIPCIRDFILSQKGVEPNNFKDWLIWNFGESIANYYMIPYNQKIWSYPLEKMETQWMQGKMPLPTKEELIQSMLMKDPKERKMPHSTFYYPLKGGIQSMVNAIAKDLKIYFCTPVEHIEEIDGKYVINGSTTYDKVISTIPLPVINKAMKLPSTVQNAIYDLKYNSLTTILFSCPITDITWLYIPSHEYRSHRVGYQSALTHYASAFPLENGCAALEIIGKRFDVTEETLEKNKILPPELAFQEILDHEFTEYAYVIHDKNYRKNTDIIKSYFGSKVNFDLLGRWGTWNYKNMDLCMLDAFNLSKKMES